MGEGNLRVHLLQHERSVNGRDVVTVVGIYSTHALAAAAQERATDWPDLRGTPDGFCIDNYGLDGDEWREGYITEGAWDLPSWLPEAMKNYPRRRGPRVGGETAPTEVDSGRGGPSPTAEPPATDYSGPHVVHLLEHGHVFDDGKQCGKLIGLYSSEEQAASAIGRAGRLPGFRDCPNGFRVSAHRVDVDEITPCEAPAVAGP